METTEGNKLIAEFMGGDLRKDGKDEFFVFDTPDGRSEEFVENLKYHKSWDWLILVIQKTGDLIIDRFPLNATISKSGIYIGYNNHNCAGEQKTGDLEIVNTLNINYFANNNEDKKSLIQSVWIGVVQFIKWYNKKQNETRN
jgi:hypothetical protein